MSVPKPLALIIEDDADSSEALGFILRDWGADVIAARDEAGVDALGDRVGQVSFIITDFHLGRGADGVTLVQRLTQAAPRARVLVLSGSFHGRAPDAAAAAGLDVMQKPARAEAIIAWLDRA